MKKRLSFSTRVPSTLTVIAGVLLILTACEKTPTVIEPEEDQQQTLIITRNGVDPIQQSNLALEEDGNYYARMWVAHGRELARPIQLASGGIKGAIHHDTVVQLWTVKSRDPFAFADLGTVTLGDQTLSKQPGNGAGRVWYEIGDSLRLLELFYQDVFERSYFDTQALFTGKTAFSITGSPDVQDVSVEVEFRQNNYIVSPAPTVGDGIHLPVLDAEQDLTIELAHEITPVGGVLMLYERLEDVIDTNPIDQRFAGVSHLIVKVTEPTKTIVIPSSELQQLKNGSQINQYILQLGEHGSKLASIPLLDHNGTGGETLDLMEAASYDNLEFSFKE